MHSLWMKESVLPLEPGTWWGTLHMSLPPGSVIYLWMLTHSRGGHYPEKHRKGEIFIWNIYIFLVAHTWKLWNFQMTTSVSLRSLTYKKNLFFEMVCQTKFSFHGLFIFLIWSMLLFTWYCLSFWGILK